VSELLKSIATRIEEALKREREELDKRISDLEAYAKLWTGRADELRLKCDEFYAKAKPVGNAAVMREALVAVKKSIDDIGKSSIDCDPTIIMVALTQVCARLSARIEQALAAPARNCDRFADAESARQAWLDDAENWDDFGSPKLELHEWLFAPAAERKGDGDAI
jgi:hypothetical protein